MRFPFFFLFYYRIPAEKFTRNLSRIQFIHLDDFFGRCGIVYVQVVDVAGQRDGQYVIAGPGTTHLHVRHLTPHWELTGTVIKRIESKQRIVKTHYKEPHFNRFHKIESQL